MLNKSSKVLSYSVLTVTLLMGNITTPTSFFEDDENFTNVPSQLSTGWGFSFNKAQADCSVTVECIEVHGTPPPIEPWIGTPEPDPQPLDPEESDLDSGFGDSTPSTPPVVDPVLQCKIDALNQKNADYRMADNIFMGTLYICNLFVLKPEIAVCGAAALWGANTAKAEADERYLIASAKCKP